VAVAEVPGCEIDIVHRAHAERAGKVMPSQSLAVTEHGHVFFTSYDLQKSKANQTLRAVTIRKLLVVRPKTQRCRFHTLPRQLRAEEAVPCPSLAETFHYNVLLSLQDNERTDDDHFTVDGFEIDVVRIA
jgi:hypothetical protein